VSVILAGAACSSSATPPSESTATAAAAQASSSGPTLDLDLGTTDPTQVVTVSIIFKVNSDNQLEQFVQATQEPGSPSYHRFLSVSDFTRRFSPSAHDIARVSAYLTPFGIQVGATLADNLVLKATGTVGAFTQAFTFTLHDYQSGGIRYHRPASPPSVPHALSDVMLVVAGFSSQPAFKPKLTSTKAAAPKFTRPLVLPTNGTATGLPGNYTVGDFANNYDVNPLYAAGIDGTGSTIGIATLANFYPADAYTYWSSIGLRVRQNRIQQIHIDEGAPLGSQAGSGETSLDVEQSGGVAPNADIIVYDAPNTDGGFLDLFYNAASDNLVDSLSVSWGEAEVFYNAALAGTDLTAELGAFHQAFLEAAAQGISVFASAGDSGAYDASGLIPGLSNFLTVDVPGSDPAITAAGGTTTPFTFTPSDYGLSAATPDLVISQEQVWGWDYLAPYFPSQFSVGGGGGVSSVWPAPWYQDDYPGARTTEPGQVVTYTSTTGTTTTTQTLLTLPAKFEGRNVPDVSADADPFSGYLLYSTADGGWLNGYGGTSFVAPQLNGVSALVRQRTHGRVGLWNPMLYRFARSRGESGSVDITAGDNWFYDGVRGYEPAAGLGVIDAAKFAKAVAQETGCE
jgi:subtilase family serine protease